jgi:cobalt-zinc-cadmium efflux system outer membrane protein
MRRPVAIALVATCCSTLASAASAQAQVITGPLTYDRALDLATSRNLGLIAARRARAIREAAIRTARARPNPEVGAETSRDTPHHAVIVELPVEWANQRGRRIALAREELTLADVEVQVEARTVRTALRNSFYALMAGDERVRIAESLLGISRRLRDIAQERFDTGDVPRLDVLQADLAVVRSETDLELARSTRLAAQADLNAVLDLPPQQPLTLAGALNDGTAPITYEQAVAFAQSSNIDLLGLNREIAVEERRVELLRAERMPSLTLVAGTFLNSPGDFKVGPMVGVIVGLPIFSRNQGPIAESIAKTAQLRAKHDATRREVDNGIFGAVAEADAARRQADAYDRRLLPAATNLVAVAEEGYRAGRTSVLAVLEAQQSLRDIGLEALQAALDLQEAIAELEAILGTSIR